MCSNIWLHIHQAEHKNEVTMIAHVVSTALGTCRPVNSHTFGMSHMHTGQLSRSHAYV